MCIKICTSETYIFVYVYKFSTYKYVKFSVLILPHFFTFDHYHRKMRKLPTMILPLLWFEASAELPADLAEEIKPVLYLLRSSTITIVWGSLTGVSVIVGVAVMVWGCKG